MQRVASREVFYVSKYSGMICPSLSPLSTIIVKNDFIFTYLWPTLGRSDRGRP